VASGRTWAVVGDDVSSAASCCGSARSSVADGVTVAGDELWATLSSSESEAGDDDGDEATACDIQQHLDCMNAASDEVNALQRALAEHAERRRALEAVWASGGARLAGAAGREGLLAARACALQSQYCHAAQEAVAAASARYSVSSAAGAAQEHAACLAQWRDAQGRLAESRRRLEACGAEVAAYACDYLETEALYRDELAEIDGLVAASAMRLCEAKTRYRSAMDALEALSEELHARRGGGAGRITCGPRDGAIAPTN